MALRIGYTRRDLPTLAYDYMTLAVEAGLEGRNLAVGKIHPSHGVLTVEYPLTWLGRQIYQVREIGRSRLPARFSGAADTAPVRVVHTSDEACKDTFIRSAYGAPCVQATHPERVNVHYAPPGNLCGFLGTSHRLIETPKGLVPVVPALVGCADTQALIVAGAQGSSLAYSYVEAWAEDVGDVQCGDTLYRAVQDYDIVHQFGTVNHMVIACTVEQARGKIGSRLIFDLAVRPRVCYPRGMAIHKLTPAIAQALAPLLAKPQADTLARDLAVEIPDDAPADLAMWIGKLSEALGAALTQRDELAGALGTAEAASAGLAQQVTTLQADAQVGRDLAITAALRTAADLGTVLHRKDATHPDGVETVLGVKHAVVKSRTSKAYDLVPEGAPRDRYVEGAWDMLVASKTAQDKNPDGTLPVAPPAALAAILGGRKPTPPAPKQ